MLLRTTVAMAGLLLASNHWLPNCSASDALLKMSRIAVQTDLNLPDNPIQEIFQSHLNPKQYYHMPSDIRFAKDQEDDPMFTIIKFNLAYANGNWVAATGSDKKTNEVLQGGVMKATFTNGLRNTELQQLRDALAKHPGVPSDFQLGRLPLDTASFMIVITDPENEDSQVAVGPFDAPLTSDIVSVMIPLSKAATDILMPILEKDGGSWADAPVDVKLAMTYSGFDVPAKIKVTGSWDAVGKMTDTHASAKGGFWFFSAEADYQKLKQDFKSAAKINIEVSGDLEGNSKEEIQDRVLEEIMSNIADTNSLKPTTEDQLAEGKGDAPDAEAGEIKGKSVSLGVGFSMKKVERSSSGSIEFEEEGYRSITIADMRFGKLDFTVSNKDKHLKTLNPSDWRIATPAVELADDVLPWFKNHQVSMTFPTDHGPDTQPWNNPVPGEAYTFGVFNFPKADDGKGTPLVPITYSCVFNSDAQSLAEAGIAGADSPLGKKSLDMTYSIYAELFGSQGIVIPFLNDYSRQPTGLISKGSIPLRPENQSVKFKISGPSDIEYSEDDDSEAGVEDIVLRQRVVVEIPVVDRATGTISYIPKTVEKTINLDDAYFKSKRAKVTYDNLFIFPQAEFTISYSAFAEGKEDIVVERNQAVAYEPGSTITLDFN